MFKRKKEKSQYSEIERIKNNSQDNEMLSSTIMFDFSIIFKLAIGLAVIFLLIYFYKDSGTFVRVNKQYEYVEKLTYINKPKQETATGGTVIKVDKEKCGINISGII